MKVGIVSSFQGEDENGLMEYPLSWYTYQLIRGVLAQDPQHESFSVYSTFQTKPIHSTMKVQLENSQTANLDIHRCFRKNVIGLFGLGLRLVFKRYSVIHIQHETYLYGGPMTILFFPLFLALLRLRTTVLVTLHHIISQDRNFETFTHFHHSRIPPFFVRLGYRYFYTVVGMVASRVIVHTNFGKNILCENYGMREEKISVIPHGLTNVMSHQVLSPDKFRERFGIPSSASTIFGFFSEIEFSKGLDYLIEEFCEYAATHPRSVLLIAGNLHARHKNDPVYNNYILDLKRAASERCPGQILWHGFLDSREIASFFSAIHCLIIPYRDFNGGSAILSLAIGSGVTFLASSKFGPLIERQELLFQLHPHALSAKLAMFSQDNQCIIEAAKETMKEMNREGDWMIVGKRTYEVYLKELQTKNKILLVGAYGQGNVGDDVLLSVCLNQLSSAQCVVASSRPTVTSKEFSVQTVSSHGFPLRFITAFLSCSVVVVGGGDQFKIMKQSFHRSKYSLLLKLFALVLFAKICRKPTVLLGIGIGNVSTSVARFLSRTILSLATIVTCRESNSVRIATSFSRTSNVVLSSDLSFLLPKREVNSSANIGEAVTLAIAPTYHLDNANMYSRVISEVGKAADTLMYYKEVDNVRLLPFQTSYTKVTDGDVSKEIINSMKFAADCSIADNLSQRTLCREYNNVHVLWGMRLHSLIFALLCEVPFIAFIYDDKIKNFLQEIQYEEWGLPFSDIFKAELIVAKHRELSEQYEKVRKHLRIQVRRMRSQSQINRDIFVALAKGDIELLYNKNVENYRHIPAVLVS